MPLDATDIEKITTIIERATSRIETDIKMLMPRSEYEQRHIEIYNRTAKNEHSIEEIVKWAMSEHEKINAKIDGRFDTLDTAIKGLKEDISSQRITTIRYIITVIIGIAIGVAIPLFLRAIGV